MKSLNNTGSNFELTSLNGIEILNQFEMFKIRGGGDEKQDPKDVDVYIPKE